jgi:uncharacterized SAM-binding protein YcdF (DUF218 family)
MRRFLIISAVVLGAAYLIGIPLFLLREDDPLPSDADAVVVLSGSDRTLPAAQALLGGGIAPTLVVSADGTNRDRKRYHLCRTKSKPEGIVCVSPGQITSFREAPAITALAKERKWDTVVLVTSRYHLLNAERELSRCGDLKVFEYGVDEPWWRSAVGVPLEWVKLGLGETVRRGC